MKESNFDKAIRLAAERFAKTGTSGKVKVETKKEAKNGRSIQAK